jgi:hypothetical protein
LVFSGFDVGEIDFVKDSARESEELSGTDRSECGSLVSVDLDSEWAADDIAAHVVAGDDHTNSLCAEVYDSGRTRHLSHFREDLENFTEISPKTFRVANKKTFAAVGTGELIVDVPNGANSSQLQLSEVLYSPEVGHTLISIGRLDKKGFSGEKCTITGPDGKRVREVPKNCRGFYQVDHEPESASAVDTR